MKITDNLKMREVNTISPKLSYYYTKVIRLNDRSLKKKKKKNFKVKLSSEVRTTVSPFKKKKTETINSGTGFIFSKK